MKRRAFLKTSLTVTTLAGLDLVPSSRSSAASAPSGEREYYELRIYRLKPDASSDLLHAYLEKAALPALNRLGCRPVGVFTEIESKDAPAVYVLIPYPNLEIFAGATARLQQDAEYLKAGADYLQTSKDHPGFDRIDSSLMMAFAGLPKLELPAYAKEKKPRIFELRTYESYSEQKALKKIDMFNDGEIEIMRDVGLGPIFYGQTLVGSRLPHLTYMLSGEDRDAHKQHWGGFGKHPIWNQLKNDPQYADTVSKITNVFLAPTAYSQI